MRQVGCQPAQYAYFYHLDYEKEVLSFYVVELFNKCAYLITHVLFMPEQYALQDDIA